MKEPISEAYRRCAEQVRRAGSSFYYGMRLLPVAKRNAIYAVYAWSRICDDAVDDFSGAEARRRLAEAEEIYAAAQSDNWPNTAHPVSVALGDAIRRFRLSDQPFHDLIIGLRTDLEPHYFNTFDELELYCRQVAGTIGVLCVEIFGYSDPRARELAVDLGVALQMTNILRDLKEDVACGRLYLPLADLAASQIAVEEVLQAKSSAGLRRLLAIEVERARAYYLKAMALFSLVEPDALACLKLLYGVYFLTLQKVEKLGGDVWQAKIRISRREKLKMMGVALWTPPVD